RRSIALAAPPVPPRLEPELWRPVEGPRAAEESLEDRARVVDRESDPQRHHERNPPEPRERGAALRLREVGEHRGGRGEEECRVRGEEEDAPARVAREYDRVDDEREQEEQHVGHVGREVERGLELHAERRVALPDSRKELARDLDRAADPAMLLRLESVHLDRELARAADVPREHESPSLELGAIAEIEVLGERVRLPPARIQDARPA